MIRQRKSTGRSGVHPINRPVFVRNAIEALKTAREELRIAGANNAADYVARALKSAEGALRHSERIASAARAAQ